MNEQLNLFAQSRGEYKINKPIRLIELFGGRIRKLTPLECMRLMGFSDKDEQAMRSIGMSDSAIYHCAGDSIVVDVLMDIFKELL